MKWATHKTKLGDPIKTFAEAIDSATLAAFGLEFGAAVLTKTAPYTVTTADRGRFISVTGTTTITLPAAATAGQGFPIAVLNNGSNTVTVDGDGSETINGSVTKSLDPGNGLIITSDGSAWYGLVITDPSNFASAVTFDGATTFNADATFNQLVDIAADFNLSGVETLGTWSTDQDDVAIGATTNVVRMQSSTGVTVGGFSASQVDGRMIHFANIGTSSITFNDEDTGSTAANRIRTSGAGLGITEQGGCTLWYDGTSSRWRIMSNP